jgi:hypothetical protein
LGVGVHAEVEVVEEIMEVNLPVKFSIGRLWECPTSLFSAAPTFYEFVIYIERLTQLL